MDIPSLQLHALPQVITMLAEESPVTDLPALLEALKSGMERVERRIKQSGADPGVESLVQVAMERMQGDVSQAALRKIVTGITVEEAQTAFEESQSDMRYNQEGASFEVKFHVGGAEPEGYICGEATARGGRHDGRIECSYFMREDDLDEKVDWSENDENSSVLQKDAEAWRAAVGLNAADVTWQDFARAVHVVVSAHVSDSQYNKDDWVWEYVDGVITTNLHDLGNGTSTNEANERPDKIARTS